jgi:hypothetical protein
MEEVFIYLFILMVCWPQLCQQTHPKKKEKKRKLFLKGWE